MPILETASQILKDLFSTKKKMDVDPLNIIKIKYNIILKFNYNFNFMFIIKLMISVLI
jgi:hypothetical protein